ncbi:glycosyltransferase [candidate division KSB1 bacterium]
MKIALVHDWLICYGGSEKVVKEILEIFGEQVDVFSLVDWLNEEDRKDILKEKKVKVSPIQKLPFARKYFRNLLPIFPYTIEQFDLSAYDLVISSSSAIAKGVLTSTNQIHICYCHTPMRYAWDLYNQYMKQYFPRKGIKSFLVRRSLHRIRIWDYCAAQRVDHFIANSAYISKRIKKYYSRDSKIIYPPVDCNKFILQENKENYYLTASRLVPYKMVSLILDVFAKRPDLKLIIIGDGPEYKKIRKKATPNVQLISFQGESQFIDFVKKAKAFVAAANEDFGITIVEAQSTGTPVIAYKKGGYLETVLENKTGIFFEQQNPESIFQAIDLFERKGVSYSPVQIRQHALKFNRERFRKEITVLINEVSRLKKIS